MARKDRYYFDHDYTARNDDKILELRAEYGAEGYGIFWMIIETMAENEDGGIKASLMGGLSLGFNVAKDRLMAIVSYCVNIELFYESDGFFYSRRLLEHKTFRKKLSNSGKEGAEKRWGNSPPNAKESKREDIKGNKIKEESSAHAPVILDETGLCYDIEKYLLSHQKDFEAVCQNAMKGADFVKKILRKYHLWNQKEDQYPKKPLQLIAGLQYWILNENNYSKNGHTTTSTIGKTFEPD